MEVAIGFIFIFFPMLISCFAIPLFFYMRRLSKICSENQQKLNFLYDNSYAGTTQMRQVFEDFDCLDTRLSEVEEKIDINIEMDNHIAARQMEKLNVMIDYFQEVKEDLEDIRLQLGILDGCLSRSNQGSSERLDQERLPYSGNKRGPKPKRDILLDE